MGVDKVVAELLFIQLGEVQTGHQETFLYEKGGQTLEQTFQKGG